MIENLQETIKGLITFFSIGVLMMLIIGSMWKVVKELFSTLEN